ncbi:MAG: molybdenum cofactor biosynthesis protein MoaE, partial [Methanoregula sp.]|nr:molybdenum cofactor biosynthesis protein MoaE [Methanoregula sp.]
GLLHVDIIHRIGRLTVGENILIIVVAAGHREAAYAGSRFIIEAIKAGVPIWKKELTKDGGRWVPGEHGHGKPKTS